MRATTVTRSILLMVFVASLSSMASAAEPLFTSMTQADAEGLLTPEEIAIEDVWAISSLRRDYVVFDDAPLFNGVFGDVTVEINLFPDVTYTSTLQIGHDSRRLAWTGSLTGAADSRAKFFKSRALGRSPRRFSGAFRDGFDAYRLRKVGQGQGTRDLYAIEQVDFSALVGDDDPPEEFASGPGERSKAGSATLSRPARTQGSGGGGTPRIDILYVYTAEADAAVAGSIDSYIYRLEDDSNEILDNTEIDAEFRVVGIHEIEFEFSTEGDLPENRDLIALATDPEVQALRDGAAADLVQFLVDSSWSHRFFGAARPNNELPLDPRRAYSIVEVGTEARYTSTHELAHNMGAQHAPGDLGAGNGVYFYCQGYRDLEATEPFRTVMASANGCDPGNPCSRIPQFSSETVKYLGRDTGNSTQRNQSCLDSTAAAVADFRSQPVQYQLTMTVAGSGGVTSASGGINCPGDCVDSVDAGSPVVLTADGDPGWAFDAWFGDAGCQGSDNPLEFMMTEDITCEAGFIQSSLPFLTVDKLGTGSGSVTSSPSGITCGESCQSASAPFQPDETVQLSAQSESSDFDGWGGDCSADGTVDMDMDRACTATFTAVGGDPVLTLHKAGSGSGTVTSSPDGINCDAGCANQSASFDPNTPVQLSQMSDDSTFVGWSGDCSPSGSVTMSSNKSCTATFEQSATVTLTVGVTNIGDADGKITSSLGDIDCQPDCGDDFQVGTTVTLQAKPGGAAFLGWTASQDCPGTVVGFNLTVVMNEAHHCEATFKLIAP